MPRILHLTTSSFFGGPERQMLELARHLPPAFQTVFAAFVDRGCEEFLGRARDSGFRTAVVPGTLSRPDQLCREIVELLRREQIDILCCHGYKADVLGWWAGRRTGVPVLAVSRGWTAETLRVRMYERLDRLLLRWMDCIVCVSHAQAARVLRAGVAADKIRVIANAVRLDRFAAPDPEYGARLAALFPQRPQAIVGAAGRLSPEKGFGVFVEAARQVVRTNPGVGFVLFGEGRLRESLQTQIRQLGLDGRFVLTGFRADLDRYLPHWDLMVLPSFTEGLPNVVLEAFAVGIPVVATRVGGTPELVDDGASGYLVPPGDADALARRILDVLAEGRAAHMGQVGRNRVEQSFSFTAQAGRYQQLFESVLAPHVGSPQVAVPPSSVGL